MGAYPMRRTPGASRSRFDHLFDRQHNFDVGVDNYFDLERDLGVDFQLAFDRCLGTEYAEALPERSFGRRFLQRCVRHGPGTALSR